MMNTYSFVPKERFTWLVLTVSFLTLLFFTLVLSDFCRTNDVCRYLYDDIYLIVGYLTLCVFVIPFFPFLIISNFISKNSYANWKKFALISLPLLAPSILLTLMGIGRMGNAFFIGADYTIHLFAVIYGLFFLTSLLIIGISSWRNR